jgi:signal transduction histidine kinase
MTADIAHELRNPLAVQRAQLEALQDGILELEPENLQSVIEQNTLLERLVDDLRTLALADSGNLELNLQTVNLQKIVENMVLRYKPEAAAKNVGINLDYPALEEVEWRIQIDRHRVEQIIGNLLSNAIRFSPAGSKINLTLEQDSNNFILTVLDHGDGIPPDALPNIFDRFYRGDSSRSRSQGGTGLGLNIASQLADAHGGKIIAGNHKQGGAQFSVVLPKSQRNTIGEKP